MEYQVITNPHNPLAGKSYEEVKLAVQQYGGALQYVHNQTDELCRLAVQQYGGALQYIHSQTEELCRLAVQQNESVSQYVADEFIHLF